MQNLVTLDDLLHDRLVIDQRLTNTVIALAEEWLTLGTAAGIALAIETAAHNAETLRSGSGQVGELPMDKASTSVRNLLVAAKAAICHNCGKISYMATPC